MKPRGDKNTIALLKPSLGKWQFLSPPVAKKAWLQSGNICKFIWALKGSCCSIFLSVASLPVVKGLSFGQIHEILRKTSSKVWVAFYGLLMALKMP